MTLEASDLERYVVAKYYGGVSAPSRATRKQVRRFLRAAFIACVREHGDALRGRQRGVADRLALAVDRVPVAKEELKRPHDHQLSLLAGAALLEDRK